MQTFTIGLGRLWWIRMLGRNRLVRPSDRIEAVVCCLAVLIVIAAIPVVASIGTSVHETRVRVYAEQAQTRHQVTVTALEDTAIEVEPNTVWYAARATWNAGGRDHVDVVTWPGHAKRGDQKPIWVDATGQEMPAPRNRAVTDAFGVALSIWFAVAGASAALVALTRRRLDRWRYRQWEHAIDASRDNDGQANRQ